MNEEIEMVAQHIANNLENGNYISTEMLQVDCDKKEELLANIRDIYSNMKLMRIVKQKENEASTKLAEEYKAISSFIKNIARDENDVPKQDTPEQKRIREELKYMGYVVYEDSFAGALKHGENSKNKLFACEFANSSEVDFKSLNGSTAIVVGSEGGFSKAEFELAKSMGYKTVYLGKRILRAETASIALLGIIMYSLEELK
jgi:hypothetical protein